MPNSIELKNITFQYPQGKLVFSNFKQIFEEGKTYGVIGNNGIGKSTLGKLMVKILPLNGGKILLNGVGIDEMSIIEVSEKIGYVYQNPSKQLFASTVYEELAFPLNLTGESNVIVNEKVLAQLEKFGLLDFKDVVPFHLSEGEKQRLVIAGALMRKSEFFIFDEPTTALDTMWKDALIDSIRNIQAESGTCFIIISHDKEFLKSLNATMVEMR